MNFGFSAEQEQLRAAVRGFLEKESPLTFARGMLDDEHGTTDAFWRQLADLGWLGLAVPEAHGGSGLGLMDLAIVAEEAGAVVMPGPFHSTVCLALPLVARARASNERDRTLAGIAGGTTKATVAWVEDDGVWRLDGFSTRATTGSEGYVICGKKLFVPDARSADCLLVAASTADGTAVFSVAPDGPGVRIEAMCGIDQTRKLDAVYFDDAVVPAGAKWIGEDVAVEALRGGKDVAQTLLAAEMCGAAAAALELSVEYTKIREQFGRPIATFQALQHKMADMKVAVENARSLAYYAAWALDHDAGDAGLAAAMAKAYASDACVKTVADAIQVHGGVGFTWEHDLHLYLKRVKSAELTYGDASAQREAAARLLDF